MLNILKLISSVLLVSMVVGFVVNVLHQYVGVLIGLSSPHIIASVIFAYLALVSIGFVWNKHVPDKKFALLVTSALLLIVAALLFGGVWLTSALWT